MILQAVPLIVSPAMIVAFLSPEVREASGMSFVLATAFFPRNPNTIQLRA